MRQLILSLVTVPLLLHTAFAQAPKKLDPCRLVTKAEIQEIVGGQIGDPVPNRLNASVCDVKAGSMGTIGFLAQQAGPGQTADKVMAELKKRNIKSEEAAGIGDRSFFASMGYGMVQLNTFKGTNYIIITMMLPASPEAKTKNIAGKLMKKAVARL